MVSASIVLAALSIHTIVPSARRYTQPFYELPYPDVEGQYVQGADDALFVLGWLVMVTAIRAAIIEGTYQYITWLRVMSRKDCMRFAEQAFLLVYYGTSFSLGMVRGRYFWGIALSLTTETLVPTHAITLLAQLRRTLVYMALTPNIWGPEVVLSRSTLVLASANSCH